MHKQCVPGAPPFPALAGDEATQVGQMVQTLFFRTDHSARLGSLTITKKHIKMVSVLVLITL